MIIKNNGFVIFASSLQCPTSPKGQKGCRIGKEDMEGLMEN